ncbi:hypothetical protein FQN60_004292 [Etheostoma spectabile]|uniref:Uncharacterized protein n=1 Tax=Etheostoma spectabile TaxID=54343 RepID=A0A5J5CT68_9PERO|nr:hypothetical protein FQN60_004292 [Etheostoma spectabile]
MAAMPYIPSFFPHTHSPTGHGSLGCNTSPASLGDLRADVPRDL